MSARKAAAAGRVNNEGSRCGMNESKIFEQAENMWIGIECSRRMRLKFDWNGDSRD